MIPWDRPIQDEMCNTRQAASCAVGVGARNDFKHEGADFSLEHANVDFVEIAQMHARLGRIALGQYWKELLDHQSGPHRVKAFPRCLSPNGRPKMIA